MLYTGLVSITFRDLDPAEIVKLVSKAGLDAIEWGGDAHVPHGDLKTAANVAAITRDAGIKMPSYGSYYRVGMEGEKAGKAIVPEFKAVLDSAMELNSQMIRVWAGDKSSDDASDRWWKSVLFDTERIAEMAEAQGIGIAFEYHGGTLTDTAESALNLLQLTQNDNVFTYWQPPNSRSEKYRIDGLTKILPWLTHIHVFNWNNLNIRLALDGGIKRWKSYLDIMAKTEGDRYAFIEFVKGGKPEQFFDDAKVMKELADYYNNK